MASPRDVLLAGSELEPRFRQLLMGCRGAEGWEAARRHKAYFAGESITLRAGGQLVQ